MLKINQMKDLSANHPDIEHPLLNRSFDLVSHIFSGTNQEITKKILYFHQVIETHRHKQGLFDRQSDLDAFFLFLALRLLLPAGHLAVLCGGHVQRSPLLPHN